MEKRTLLFFFSVLLSFYLVQWWFGTSAPHPQTEIAFSIPKKEEQKSVVHSDQEEFYVLENRNQQLVFSTRGGALTEINLPFGLVKELEIDRTLQARFPLVPAKRFEQEHLSEGTLGGYYPLLRRSLDCKHYALNLLDEQGNALLYRVARFEKALISFEAIHNGSRIVKTFSIPEESSYCFELHVQVDEEAGPLWLTSGIPEVELMSGSFVPSLRYQVSRGTSIDVKDLELSDKKPVADFASLHPDWVSNSNGFFGVILTPDQNPGFRVQKIAAGEVPSRLGSEHPGYMTSLSLKKGSQTIRIFAGPLDQHLLKQLAQNESSENYEQAQTQQGWFSFITQPFSQFLTFLLEIFYSLTNSWGFSIILLTIALRLMMYPLNSWSIRSTLKMQELAPKVKAIQERFKKDPKKGQLEVMNLYRERGVNPFSGCLPMLLQMPFLIGMFYVLKSSFPLRGASFVPGWIDNLAAPDVLFSWTGHIWLIGNQFHLLPILTGLSMYLQQKLTSKTPKDEGAVSDMQKQQKLMAVVFPIFLTILFYSFPSGLNIYFLFSTLLGILQQWMVAKKLERAVQA